MKYDDFVKKLSKQKDFQEAIEKNRLAFEIAEMIMDIRLKCGITQAELARLVDTKQPSIARIEHGEHIPTIPFLEKIAKALGTKLISPKFEILQKAEFDHNKISMEINYYTSETAVPEEFRELCGKTGESRLFTSNGTENILVTLRGEK